MKKNNYYYDIDSNTLNAAEKKELAAFRKELENKLANENKARKAKGLSPRRSVFEYVKSKWIKIDKDYQREANEDEISNIISEFDVDRVGVIVGSIRNDGIYVNDGQHRIISSVECGEDELFMQIYLGITPEEEAEIFSDQYKNATTLSRVVRLRADYFAKRQYAIDIVTACESRRFHLRFPGVATGTARNINAVTILIDVYNRYGLSGLERGLDMFIAAGWDDYDEMCKHVFLSMAQNINSILKKNRQQVGGKAWCKIVSEMAKGRPGAFLGAAHTFADTDDNKGNMHTDEKALKEYMIHLAK